MASAVYILCAVTSMACAVLLLRNYFRTPSRLALWTGLAFVAFAANNLLLFVDMRVIQSIDFTFWRDVTALLAVILLLYGLVTETT
jgi:hypothetical protein